MNIHAKLTQYWTRNKVSQCNDSPSPLIDKLFFYLWQQPEQELPKWGDPEPQHGDGERFRNIITVITSLLLKLSSYSLTCSDWPPHCLHLTAAVPSSAGTAATAQSLSKSGGRSAPRPSPPAPKPCRRLRPRYLKNWLSPSSRSSSPFLSYPKNTDSTLIPAKVLKPSIVPHSVAELKLFIFSSGSAPPVYNNATWARQGQRF